MNLKQKQVKSTKPEKPLDLARREDMIRQSVERHQPRDQASVWH